IERETKAVAEYKSGNTASIQYLVGQGMKAMKGSGNPGLLKKQFEELLQ
ncbi:MAG: Asp-tRNA(Asn)/Glu-tRNA(Gln) amidotransferase GatCAB subunit, partial [Parcubacteria group bacterium]|nr:Asp-tRNA(Asn)/Glu-tRNA(Gln) amidotransferase GatCAB subunit [Parcubacteria group bacterium]